MTLTVNLPWPYAGLNPNESLCWQARSHVKRKYRMDCFLLAQKRVTFPEGLIHMTVTFNPPCVRHRDQDNLVASCKALFDGLADAWKVNDTRFRAEYVMGDVVKGGAVTVEVRQ